MAFTIKNNLLNVGMTVQFRVMSKIYKIEDSRQGCKDHGAEQDAVEDEEQGSMRAQEA